MPKNILVTGGFGFIGTTLVSQLLEKELGARIHIVDDNSTSPIIFDDYLEQVHRPANLTYDICRIDEYFARGFSETWDEIYHLASPVGPAGVLIHAGEMVRQVVRDIYLLMDYCRETGARLLDISTSEIYGGGVDGLCTETTDKIVPHETTARLEYAIAKLAAETALINACRSRGLNASIVRPFNVAGPRQSPKGGFVLPRFIQQSETGKPMTVFGDGSARRAFTHVDDMCSGIILTMAKGRVGEAYNVGNPDNKTTILALAHTVREVLQKDTGIIHVDPKTIYGPTYAEASDKYPDSSKVMEELGWKPRHDIPGTIRDYVREYRRQREAGTLKDVV